MRAVAARPPLRHLAAWSPPSTPPREHSQTYGDRGGRSRTDEQPYAPSTSARAPRRGAAAGLIAGLLANKSRELRGFVRFEPELLVGQIICREREQLRAAQADAPDRSDRVRSEAARAKERSDPAGIERARVPLLGGHEATGFVAW